MTALIGRPPDADERFAVAVSGGPDSLALLVLASAALGDRVRALTVDHALRADSAAEAAAVATICHARGIAHTTLIWQGDKPGANLQAEARTARYRLMADWCGAQRIGWLLTGHQQNDVAETLLLRLARGAGSTGLATMRARRRLGADVELLRPLRDVPRADLAAIVTAAGLVTADDPSNAADRFDRTHARAMLAANAWLAPARLAASAAHIAEVETALDWASDRAWDSRTVADPAGITLDATGLPAELVRRLTLRALATLAAAATPRGPDVTRMIAALTAGRAATLAGVQARAPGPDAPWRFGPAPPRKEPTDAKSHEPESDEVEAPPAGQAVGLHQ